MSIQKVKRSYDHRLWLVFYQSKDPSIFPELSIPESTRYTWCRKKPPEFVTHDCFDKSKIELISEIEKLRKRFSICTAMIQLLKTVLVISGFRLDEHRLPDGSDKSMLISSIEKARKLASLTAICRCIYLSPARYGAWNRAKKDCQLDDKGSCPKTFPNQTTNRELSVIESMYTSEQYDHFSIRSLALHAQRIGKVFLSPSTWSKLIRKNGWSKALKRIHPLKPKIGIRASRPNQYWHIDVSVLKLPNNEKLYIHAIIDNFSRMILSWGVFDHLSAEGTRQILIEAAQHLSAFLPDIILVDGGGENHIEKYGDTLNWAKVRMQRALVDIAYSNSMIEVFWRKLKHSYLFKYNLDSLATVKRLIAKFIDEYNTIMPHSAFRGQTPDEMFFGTARDIEKHLTEERIKAREKRVEFNRALSCDTCDIDFRHRYSGNNQRGEGIELQN